MDLDPQSIEKRDFPIIRRGYDPPAVDSHLEAIAHEVEALRRQSRSRRGESLASAASAQVQAIVEAAETSAADIERQAQLDAARIRQDAQREADKTRDDAVERSREHVNKVSEATAVMLQRLDAMEGELGALFESLRTGANRLGADLSLLEGNMGELYAAAGGARRGGGVVPVGPELVEVETEIVEEVYVAGRPELEELELEVEEAEEAAALEAAIEEEEAEEAEEAEAIAEAAEVSDDVEGARLIALNMALNGQSREEADRYLADNFDLADRETLLDEVYASVQG
ncbi:MAG TPA: DivIVA domain-containing protein [Solirubrobacteraceae bacterium]|nr:DivIVA domain-containing protein [Solirubrobacteraceae bacterium]